MSTVWSGPVPDTDSFGHAISDMFIDGQCDLSGSFRGRWAIFSWYSWQRYGCGRLGLGYGQRYDRQPDGTFMKVQG
jgi:hypothetical protein